MDFTTSQRMHAHITITLIVMWALSEKLGAGFSIATLTLGALNIQTVIPNWAAFLALGAGIFWLQRHRDAVLEPVEAWMHEVLTGEEERQAVTGVTQRIGQTAQKDQG